MSEKQLIYLASPYSHDDPAIREQRFNDVARIAALLFSRGEFVFSPILHSHPMAELHDLPNDWEFWQSYDRLMLSRCDVMYILMINGYLESLGVDAERDTAIDCDIPIVYIDSNGNTD